MTQDVEEVRSVELGEGFRLTRMASGAVRVSKRDADGRIGEKTVQPETWAQAVAIVSAVGGDAEQTARAYALHEGAG